MADFCSMEYDSITSVNTNKLYLYLHSRRDGWDRVSTATHYVVISRK